MKTERLLQYKNGPALHPAQGPFALYLKLLKPFRGMELIACDPYLGTGTTLLAAKHLRLSAIGIEIEEKYCEIAVKRLAQEMLPFDEPKQGAEQLCLPS